MNYVGIEEAIELAVDKFRGVRDKGGQPYILHCLRVMLRQEGEAAQQAGLLHDLVEDTDVTLADLATMKFAPDVIDAVDAMTHREDVSYADYVLRLASNPIARRIKLADLEDNYRIDRVALRPGLEERDQRRLSKYILTHQFLSDRITAQEYKQRMAPIEQADAE